MFDFGSMSESDLAALKARLDEFTQTSLGRTRTPAGRQLHDLTLLPTATDPRPLFLASAEPPRHAPPERPPYRRLLWHKDTNQEITVKSLEEETRKLAEGYLSTPPEQRALNPEELLALEFAQLSPEDQAEALELTATARRQALQAKLADLSEDQLAKMVKAAGGVKAARKRA